VTFRCSLDGSAFGVCASPTPYSGLAAGSHTFAVQAVQGSKTSSSTSYTWTIDLTAPIVVSINRAASSPTNAASVSWTVTFSESVVNVAAANFGLVVSGLGGSPAITGVTGSGTTYTVTASTGSGSGTLGLNLTNKDTIKDAAGNGLGGSVPVPGQVYTLDRTPPPAPTISSGPSGTTNQTSASFGFSDSESGVSFLCKLDTGSYATCPSPKAYSSLAGGSHTFSVESVDAAGNISTSAASRTWAVDATPPPKPTVTGPNNNSPSTTATFTFSDTETGVTFQCSMDNPTSGWSACTNPKTYYFLSAGTHEFEVRAVDAAGNIGDFNAWKWTISGLSSGGQNFTISGNTVSSLYPGGGTSNLDLSLRNPNSVTIYLSSLSVALPSITAPNAHGGLTCPPSDFVLTQYTGGFPIVLPPGTKTLSQLGFARAQMPSITMVDRPLNQDGCKGATLNFSYSGNAQS
jgi:hypothetical protein